MNKGLVLLGPDKTIEERAKGKGLDVIVDPDLVLRFDKTLFVAPGTEVPWDLLPAAWHFMERWDAAVPLWLYGLTAADVGSKEERKRTAAVVRDLRVLLHSVELLFVRDNADGQALMDAYREELEGSSEKRLAFLRALYRTKPRVCVLPRSWLAQVFQRSKMDARARGRNQHSRRKLMTVEISPGRFVQCHAGDEDKVLAMARRQSKRGDGRRRKPVQANTREKKVTGLEIKDYRHTAPKLVTVEVEPGRWVKCHRGDEERVIAALTGGRGG